MDGFWESALVVHDSFVFMSRMLTFYLQKMGVDMDNFKAQFDWVAYAAGVLIFVGAVRRLYSILARIAGLKGALKATTAAVGGGLAASNIPLPGQAGGPMGPPAPGTPIGGGTNAWKAAGKLGKFGILGTLWSGVDMADQRLFMGANDRLAAGGVDPGQFNNQLQSQYGLSLNSSSLKDVFHEWFGFGERQLTPTVSSTSMAGPGGYPAGTPFPLMVEPLEGDINIKIDAGEMKNMIQAVVDENNQLNFNVLLNGGP